MAGTNDMSTVLLAASDDNGSSVVISHCMYPGGDSDRAQGTGGGSDKIRGTGP
jgi:hypothetical protein